MFLPDFDFSFAIALICVFFAGIIRGFSGFGSALVMAPVLALLYGPVTSAVSILVIDFSAVLQLMRTAVRHADRKLVVTLGVGAVAGIPTGAYFLVSLDPDIVRAIISIIILFFVIILATGWRYGGPRPLPMTMATGFTSGVMGGLAGFAGPPVILYFLSGGASALTIRASIAGFFTFTSLCSILSYHWLGIFTADIVVRGLWLIPGFMIGVWLGGEFFKKASEKTFRHVVLLVLACVAAVGLLK
ncbi:sulfite exporter TauE/SafE family protein [Aestuariispira insulae]|uniref:Probable membrane transporter protein n=1 Tax=Aestuariispira insulae TaxID=1461337 RepID=A0A3D9HW14_9PROT|nr:sulfite exporter TauE/SafE family protein [Aestuariispira insulae]RED53605.1 hypothetical protein DFP90_101396 [Aestuariispira insulae]